jgi:uncharacterized membrane protein HdeD (DUF308 family)
MTRVDAVEADSVDLSSYWWVYLIVGLLSAAAGIVLVIRPSHSLKVLAVVVGIFLLLDGIVQLISAFVRDANRGLAAVIGVLGIIVGLILIRHPMHGVAAVGIVIGIWLVAAGCVGLVRALSEGSHRLLRALLGGLAVVAGIVVVAEPHIGYTTLAIIVGLWLILNGIGTIAFGVVVRGTRSRQPSPTPSAAASPGS